MLIKGRKTNRPASSGNPPGAGSHAAGSASGASDGPHPWTVENFEAGLVQDRRQDSRPERRRGYRRIEEKELISKAVEEANAIKEQARQDGFQDGLNQAQGLVNTLQEAIAKLLNAREDALLSAADDISAIAVEVAERIIKTEVMCDNSVVMALVRDTIQKAGRQNKTILVKVHPDDIAVVKQTLKDEPIPGLRAELIVMEDSTVDQGSCIVETNSGLVDASFSTQLGLLKQLFGTSPENTHTST